MNVEAFIGKPWRPLAHGPDAFDCWGLAHTAARELFGLAWPIAVYAPNDIRDAARVAADYLVPPCWRERDTAAPGALMALCMYDDTVRHVALCVDERRALHTARATSSCIVPIHRLALLWPRARFYEWAP